MSGSELNLEKDCWDIIDSYFSTIPNYISKNQIDSFNMFLDEQIAKTIRQFNPLQFVFETDAAKRYELDIIIGGTVQDGNIINSGAGLYLGKAVIRENRKNPDGTETGVTKELYPNEARLKNLTYSIPVYSDIYMTYKIIDKSKAGEETIEFSSQPIIFNKKLLGKIPCMLQSRACILSSIPRANLKEFGECPYDHGGYFIIDGKEKVITAQTRQIENKIYTKKNKPDDPVEFEAEIRSTPEDKLQPARIIRLYLRKPVKKNIKIGKVEKRIPNIQNEKSGLIFVSVPNINEPIPLFILFRALGITTDREILQYICGDFESTNKSVSNDMVNYLYDNIILAQEVRTQTEALRFIQNLVNSPSEKVKKHNLDEEEIDVDNYLKRIHKKELVDFKYIYDILYNWVFPHIGTTNLIEKGVFLGYMTQELLKTKWQILAPTSRDSYMYKRIDVSGFLVATIFRDLYFRVKNKMTHSINSHFKKLIDTDGLMLTPDNFSDFIGEDNISKIFDSEIVTDGFRYAFKNCWGLKDAPPESCKEGVVQDLARLTYLGQASHLRRVVTPLSSSSKLREPHMLHLSTYGILCPVETPDGANVGVKTNIALFTDITFGSHSSGIYQALLDNHLITLEQLPLETIITDKDIVRVILNGRLIGYHKYPNLLVERLRLLRRNALINIYTSIAWYIQEGEIKISTDSGRSCHPMLIVDRDTRKLKIGENHIKSLRQGTINWYHLIAGTNSDWNQTEPKFRKDPNSPLHWNQYDPRYYRTDKSNYELDQSGGVIEYIDTEEANTIMLASEARELEINPNTRFSHCEIHPSIIFGIMGSIIPFVGTNQLPRNLYSCGQGKQAIGVYASNYRNRMDTKTMVLYYSQKPLVQNRISKYLYNNILPYGQNAIIGIACYSGYNQDDSIIFNQSAVNRGLFRSINYRTYSIREDENEYTKLRSLICNPIIVGAKGTGIVVRNLKPGNYSKLGPDGIIREGVKVDENDIVCGRVVMTKDRDEEGNLIYLDDSEYVRRAEAGTVDKVFYSHDNNNFLFVKVRLRKEKIPELGDKFASRAGQKGIMGMLLNESDMPFSKRGIRPDMIINPQAFPKRMTISQFIETVECKECSLLGFFGDSSPFQTIPLEKLADVLEGLGYERYGTEVLYNGMTGEQIEHDIFIGPTYYERLQHQVEGKIHARAEGSITMLSKQPTGGRAVGGGLRIGEMERDAILAHGTSAFLKETMTDRSDGTDIIICDGCGLIAMVNPAKNIYHCYNCNTTKVYYKNNEMNKEQIETSRNDFRLLQIPYAMKLMTQELETMSVGMHLISNGSAGEWKKVGKYSNTETRETDLETLINLKQSGERYYVKRGDKLDAPFRAYQNIIKNLLLNGAACYTKVNTAMDRPHILDLSAGRGGDLQKWINNDYEYILALDIDGAGLYEGDECLTARFNNIKEDGEYGAWFQKSNLETGVSNSCLSLYNGEGFQDTDEKNRQHLKKILAKRGEGSFDVVSVQFSAHFCFDTISNVHGLLNNISRSLKAGGCAVITTLNGEAVYNLLKKENGYISFSVAGEKLYSLALDGDYDYLTLPSDNNGVNVRIKAYIASTGREITEFLVSPALLISEARNFGLKLMNIGDMNTYFNKLKFPTTNFLEPAYSRFEKNKVLDSLLGDPAYKELSVYSALHKYYVFIKEENPQVEFDNLDSCVNSPPAIVSPSSMEELLYYRGIWGPIKYVEKRAPPAVMTKNELAIVSNNIYLQNPLDRNRDLVFELHSKKPKKLEEIIYSRIKNGNLVEFLPVYIENLNPPITNREIIKNIQEKLFEKFKLHPELQTSIIKDPADWRLSNCYLKTTTAELEWSQLYFAELYDMFSSLCRHRKDLPDAEILIYKGTDFMFNYEPQYIYSLFGKYDALPTPFDWWLVSKKAFKSGEECKSLDVAPQIPWQQKENVAIFRGTLKGCADIMTGPKNMRQKFMDSAKKYNSRNPNIRIDAKYTDISNELLIDNLSNKPYILEADKEDIQSFDDMSKLADYKYIFCVDSNTPPMKLSYLLSTGSLVIRMTRMITEEDRKVLKAPIWYDMFLNTLLIYQDPVSKQPVFSMDDLMNADCIAYEHEEYLDIVMKWIEENPQLCQKIAENGRAKMKRILSKEFVYDYLYQNVVYVANSVTRNLKPQLMTIENIYKYLVTDLYETSVSYQLANIIQKNKDLITNYFDLSSIYVDNTNIRVKTGFNEQIFRNVQARGNNGAISKFILFLEDIINWDLIATDPIKDALILKIAAFQRKIEMYFNVNLILMGNSIQIFGKRAQECLEYLNNCISSEEIIQLPWKHGRQLQLQKISPEDLEIYQFKGKLAIVIPSIELKEARQLYYNLLKPLLAELEKRNIVFETFIIEQSKLTKLAAMPKEIVETKNDNGLVLKHNIIGLICAANRVISKIYTNMLILDYSYAIANPEQFVSRIVGILHKNQQPIVQCGYNYLVNRRDILDRLPNYLFGSNLQSITKVITEIPMDEKTLAEYFKPVMEISDNSLEKDYGWEHFKEINSYSITEGQPLDNLPGNVNRIIVDYLEGAIPPVLSMDKLPQIDNARPKESILNWSNEYLKIYLGADKLKKTANNIQILDKALHLFAERLLSAMTQVLLKYYGKNVDYRFMPTGHIHITLVKEKETVQIEQSVLPYYTIGGLYYTRPITNEMIEETSQKVSELKAAMGTSAGNSYPTGDTNKIFVVRIGDWVIYLNLQTDKLVFYNIATKTYVDIVPPELREIDFDLVLIMFKDKNESLLQLQFKRTRKFVAHPKLARYNVPISNVMALPDIPNKIVKNLLKIEPVIEASPEINYNRSD